MLQKQVFNVYTAKPAHNARTVSRCLTAPSGAGAIKRENAPKVSTTEMSFFAETEADVRAKILIFLIENKLISAKSE